MKVTIGSKAYFMALDRIPQTVAELAAYYGEKSALFCETVAEYSRYGSMFSKSDFVVPVEDLIDHIKKAKKTGFTVEMDGDDVVISKNRKDGTRVVATYSLIAA